MRIGDIEVLELAKKYGTPLYVYDEEKIEKIMHDYTSNFKSNEFETQVIFASKAFSCVAMIDLVKKNGLGLDVVSGGEIFTAMKAGFPMNKVFFHGNNKTFEELEYALNCGVGTIVVDNVDELEVLSKIKKNVNILIRLNVGVDAHTHKYIVTSHIDSKFGIGYDSADYLKAMEIIKENQFINLEGFHCHVGSQIFDINPFYAAVGKMLNVLKGFNRPMVLNIGGGFGITYTSDDKPIPTSEISADLISYIEKKIVEEKVSLKKVVIEPGRSIVAEAGYTLYKVGYQKQTPNKKYYFIDGGMTDNIRPALYQAKYNCDIVNSFGNEKTETVTIAGKCCESGDLIIENILLPKAKMGDIVIVYSTGAYGYSMSNNYNRALKPAVVFVRGNKAKVVVKRETFEDLIRNDVMLEYEEI